MDYRMKLFRNVSQICQQRDATKPKFHLRIKSVKTNTNQSFIQQKQLRITTNPYHTQCQSPIKKYNQSNKENRQNNNEDLILNSIDSQSLDLCYSPSASKKKVKPQSVPKKLIVPKQMMSKKCQQIIDIYLTKPRVKPQMPQNRSNLVRIR